MRDPGPVPRHFTVAGALLAGAWAAAVFAIVLLKYRAFLYRDFDLAIFSQITDGVLRGQWFSSIRGAYGFGDHSSLVLFLVAPLYAVARSSLTLLVLQTGSLAFAGWLIHGIASRRLRHPLLPLAATAAFLLHPALLSIALFEFHPEVFATPALIACAAGIAARSPRAVWLGAALALSTREDVFLPVAVMGLVALAQRETRRFALPLIGLALASAAFSFGVLKPWLAAGEADYGAMYERWGATPGEIALGLLRDPIGALTSAFTTPGDSLDTTIKQQYWMHLLLPVAGIPLLAPLALLPALPAWATHFLANRVQQHTIFYQYTALVLPFLGLALVGGLARIEARLPARAMPVVGIGLVLLALGSQLAFGPLVDRDTWRAHGPSEKWRPTFEDRQLAKVRDRWIRELPERGVVVAEFALLSRLSRRDSLHSLHHVARGVYTFSSRPYPTPHPVRVLIADASDWSVVGYFDDAGQRRLADLVARENLQLTARVGDLLRFERDPARPLAWPVRTVESNAGRWVAYQDSFDFGGCTIENPTLHPRDALRVRMRLRPRPGLTQPVLTQWIVTNASGERVVDHLRLLGYGFDPPSRWPAGVAREEELELLLPDDLAPGRFQVALFLGVREGQQARPSRTMDPAIVAAQGRIHIGDIEVTGR